MAVVWSEIDVLVDLVNFVAVREFLEQCVRGVEIEGGKNMEMSFDFVE